MIVDALITLLLLVSGVFGLIGSYGLWRLAQPMQRLHAPTKASTVGVGAALLASVIYFAVFKGQAVWHEVLILAFLFITTPVSALFLAKVHLHKGKEKSMLPPTGTDSDWATFTDIVPKSNR
jgi:multicomponent K+:H+ antiporter subunit G